MLTNVPQSNESFQTIPTDVPLSNEPKLTNVPLSIEPEPIIGQTEPQPQPKQVKDLVDFRLKSAAYTENPYDFSKELNIGDLYQDRIELKNHIRAYVVVNKFNLEHLLSSEYKIMVRYKGRYRETLLTAIVIDPNNHIYPLAFSITDSETTESWTYFLEIFGPNFHGYDTRFIVISDRKAKIINVVPKEFSFAIHIFCATLESTRITFRMAVKALTTIDFDKHMNAIRNTDPVGLQYILSIPKKTWSNLYIPMSMYVVTLN
ncbi:hypothetical protein GIB67_023601 [Kingdonia uniflora]|uniref:MULE transposase domain-containing protein n=1 Tax=Kingdonia uniflora TaxID=39325 RepID=A0A7J7L4Y6_9MAGN|nr:hypothetical protein GIB67_023601 [Kingdonia uniflora]